MPISALNASMAHSMPTADVQTTRSRPTTELTNSDAAADGANARSSETVSAGEVRQALEEIEAAIAPVAQALEFSIDDESGRTVVKVMDTETNEVIRQMPSEEVLAISKALDKLKGLLLRQQA